MSSVDNKHFLKEVLFRIEFEKIDELSDVCEFDQIIKKIVCQEFPKHFLVDENYTEFELKEDITLENKGINKIRIFQKDNIKKFQLNSFSIILQYNGKFFEKTKFFKDINLIIEVLKILSVDKIKLTNLRFINEVAPDIEINDWDNWINSDLHNFKFEPKNSYLIRSLTRSEYKIEDFNLIFQYGQFNLNYPSHVIRDDFILDYDCFLSDEIFIHELEDTFNKMKHIILEFYNESKKDMLK